MLLIYSPSCRSKPIYDSFFIGDILRIVSVCIEIKGGGGFQHYTGNIILDELCFKGMTISMNISLTLTMREKLDILSKNVTPVIRDT